MLNNPYVPGDPYSYDLKWLVARVKEILAQLGTLDEAIEKKIFEGFLEHSIVQFKTVPEMLAADIKDGSIVLTLGYHEAGDHGGMFYLVKDFNPGQCSLDYFLTLDNNAQIAIPVVVTPYVTPEMYGAYGDGTTDDSAAFTTAMTVSKKIIGTITKRYKADVHFTRNNTVLEDVNINGTITFEPDLYFITIQNCDINAEGKNYGIYSDSSITKLHITNTHIYRALLDNVHLQESWDAILQGVSVTEAGERNIYLSEFNDGIWNGTSYNSYGIGAYIISAKACSISATIQECKKTGMIIEGMLGSDVRLYLEQNGYEGTDDFEQSQLVVGETARCIGNNITFFAVGGSGSSMESKYGVYVYRSENNNFEGYAERHLSDGFRCTSLASMNSYNVIDKTHATVSSDWSSCTPKLYGMTVETGNTTITIEGGENFNYIPVIDGSTAYMVAFQKTGSTTGLIRVTNNQGTNVQGVSVRLYKYGTGITIA